MNKILNILVAALFSCVALAQAGVMVSGIAQDQTEAVVPGQTISLVNKANPQSVIKTESDDAGRFSFTNVPPGDYLLKVKAKGFRSVEMPVTVRNRSVSGINLVMPVKDAEESVDVRASTSQPAGAENNTNAVQINEELINSLPSQGQDILSVVNNFLSPAAQGPDGPSIVIDGVEGTDLDVPTDSIKKININKNPYSPEFRRPGLGRIEVTTKNGSRGHFDGKFASYFRNDAMDARDPFADQKPPLNRRMFETTFGGPFPIRHARFFVSASRLTDDSAAIVNATTLQGPVIQNVPTFRTNTNLLGRLDLRPNTGNTISLIYNFNSRPENDRGVGGLSLASHQSSKDDTRNKGQIIYTALVSPTLLNVAHLSFEQRNDRDGIFSALPELDVKGAFVGGANQNAESAGERKMEFQDILSYSHGANTWRFGGAFRPRHFDFNDASNFGGTFTFSSLGSFSAGSPELFEIIQGNPKLSFSQNEAYGFLEDDVQIGSHTNLMAGLRYDWQQRIDDHNNFAPRLALGFSPGTGKTVFRVGGGMFYDHMSDSVTERTLLLNGVNASEFILQNPAFPTLSLVGVTPSIWSAAPQMQTPYLIQGSTSVEHAFGAMKASVEYQFLKGIHLFRARDINTPLAGTGRPDPNLFLVRQVESTASSRSNSLSTSFQGRIAKPIKIKAQYTFSHSHDDTDGPLVLPADSRDLSGEWGRSLFDIRHRFTLAAVADLPKEFRVGTLFSAHSAPPFNITTGADSNGNGIVNDRPAGVTRNTGQGFGFTQLDLRLTKTLYILGQPKARGDKSTPDFTRLELSLDAFNVFNQANFTDVIGVISSPRFGLPTAAFQPRTLQLSAKIIFRSNRE